MKDSAPWSPASFPSASTATPPPAPPTVTVTVPTGAVSSTTVYVALAFSFTDSTDAPSVTPRSLPSRTVNDTSAEGAAP